MLIANAIPVNEDEEFPHKIVFKGKPRGIRKCFDDLDLAKSMYRNHLPWLEQNCDKSEYAIRIGYDGNETNWSCIVTYKFKNVSDAVLFRLRF